MDNDSRLFLTILWGRSPRTAIPLVVSEDPDLIAAVGRELGARLDPAPRGAPITLVPDPEPAR